MRPGIAGAVFGPGWRFWVNPVVCSVVRADAVVCCASPCCQGFLPPLPPR
ncbi:unnamed protein product [Musa acuminata var. zebrina]